MAGKKGAVHYSEEVRREAVRMFLEEGRTRAEIAKILGLRSARRIEVWVHEHRYKKDVIKKPKGRPRKQSGQAESPEQELKRLRMENDLLKKFHAELRKK
jgi:transposase